MSKSTHHQENISAMVDEELSPSLHLDPSDRMSQQIALQSKASAPKTKKEKVTAAIIDFSRSMRQKLQSSKKLQIIAQGSISACIAIMCLQFMSPDASQVSNNFTPMNIQPMMGKISPMSLQTAPLDEALYNNVLEAEATEIQRQKQQRIKQKVIHYLNDHEYQKMIHADATLGKNK